MEKEYEINMKSNQIKSNQKDWGVVVQYIIMIHETEKKKTPSTCEEQ